jgi:anti-sigma regulatory factor (Ser/Thr protein kinase)
MVRLRQSARSAGFSKDKAWGLAAAVGEMADNAAIHAKTKIGALVGYQTMEGAAVFSICDVGIGVLESLRENPSYSQIATSVEAIRTALQDGASRRGPGSGGFGFRTVFKALTAMWGSLRFRSGQGCLSMDGNDCDADRGEQTFVLDRPGF